MATTDTFRPQSTANTPSFGIRKVQPGGEPGAGSGGGRFGGGDLDDRFRAATGFAPPAGPGGYSGVKGPSGGGGGAAGAKDSQVATSDWQGTAGDFAKTAAKGVSGVLNPLLGAKFVVDYLRADYKQNTGGGGYQGDSGGKDFEASQGVASANAAAGAQSDAQMAENEAQGGGGAGGDTGGGDMGKGESPTGDDTAGTPFMQGGPVVSHGNEYMDGGQVTGPGDSNDDAVRANLSNGEFVVQAEAAQILGPEILQALNDPQFAMQFAALVRQEMFTGSGNQGALQQPTAGPAAPPPQPMNGTPPARGGALSSVY